MSIDARPDVPRQNIPQFSLVSADTLIGHRSPILLPVNSSALDYEGELAVVIGKSGFRVPEIEALTCRWLCGLQRRDLRDWQRHTHQFTPGKNFPNTGAFGPPLITPEEAGPLEDKRIETRLNGAVMQSAKLGDMIFSVPRIIPTSVDLHASPRRYDRDRHPGRCRIQTRSTGLYAARGSG